MYTVILLREPYHVDSDCNGNSTDGLISVSTAETAAEARRIIRENTKEQNKIDRRNKNEYYGDWGFIVLKDGQILEYKDIPSTIDFEYYGDRSQAPEIDISEEMQLVYTYDQKCQVFLRNFTQSEIDTYKEFYDLYKAQEVEKQERAKLAQLLAKYPDMVDKNGT